ncbi:hypothetical protein A2524_02835 [Candidatus Wolfebacteria bacterium RIFOXYD12_FULL_48_21]|nr:MAG: hypothetical protein A2524_02835 [Candidatus Wolfebacteria bacterium RIFOXYD12_FULL_48_21]OGM96785.1 MAG: hypothetical protein A2532_02660 [Candidatus Wolfebacteria bacterium RIFOXYD2_FULL_48_11]
MNKDLEKLFKEDQADRMAIGSSGDFSVVEKKDVERKNTIKRMLKEGTVITGKDFYIAAMIFHHGQLLADYKTAIKLSEQSIKKGYQKAKWLHAAGTDRLLIKQGKKQKFGTQFFKKSAKSKWALAPIKKGMTDEERARFNVPPLAELKAQVERMNKAGINKG